VEEDDSVMVAAAPAPTSAAPYVFLEDAIWKCEIQWWSVYVYMLMSCNVYIIFIIINIETLFEKIVNIVKIVKIIKKYFL
jgi:hypothetical protein